MGMPNADTTALLLTFDTKRPKDVLVVKNGKILRTTFMDGPLCIFDLQKNF